MTVLTKTDRQTEGAQLQSPPVRLESIGKTYQGNSEPALTDVSFDLNPGERLSLLGPSGSGKSTLLHLLAGFISPDEGRILIAGENHTNTPVRQRDIGLVFQSLALFPHMTVEQNVAFGLRMKRVPKQDRAERVRQALELVDMVKFADRRPAQISGGQKQRVAFARALITRPSVLLLDEPFGALDTRLREGIRREFIELQEETGIPTILVTHDQAEALEFGHRVAVMGQARLLQLAAPEEIHQKPINSFVANFVGRGTTLHGAVENVSPNEVILRLDSGELFAVPTTGRTLDLTASGHVSVFTRPEWLTVNRADEGGLPSAIRGTIERKQFAGDRFDLEVRLPGNELLLCEATLESELVRGDSVAVSFDPGSSPCVYGAGDRGLLL